MVQGQHLHVVYVVADRLAMAAGIKAPAMAVRAIEKRPKHVAAYFATMSEEELNREPSCSLTFVETFKASCPTTFAAGVSWRQVSKSYACGVNAMPDHPRLGCVPPAVAMHSVFLPLDDVLEIE
jgi:hypothetical protein